MPEVKLLDEWLRYEAETGKIYWKKSPSPHAAAGAEAGSVEKNGYLVIGFQGKRYKAHRIAWALAHGTWPSEKLDHKDRNKTNNKLKNLRAATSSQNGANRGNMKNNTSGCKGVYFHKTRRTYRASIPIKGKNFELGEFKTLEEAAIVRHKAAKQLFGEFASEE